MLDVADTLTLAQYNSALFVTFIGGRKSDMVLILVSLSV
mgnify:CR=1 FL=1